MSGTCFVGTRSKLTRTPAIYLAAIAGVAFIAVAMPVGAAQAATAGPDPTVANVNVNNAITLTGLTPSFTLTGNPGALVTANGVVTMLVTSNNAAGYNVTVEAAGATLVAAGTGTGGNTESIPIGSLLVRQTAAGNAGAWSPSSNTAPVTVHTQGVPSAATGDTISNDYEITIPAVNPDTYSQTLNYVATTL